METNEKFWIEAVFERGHRMMDQPASAADMQSHIVALRRHAVDIARGDPDQASQVRRPEFVQPLRRFGTPFTFEATEAMLTMLPPPFASMLGKNALMV